MSNNTFGIVYAYEEWFKQNQKLREYYLESGQIFDDECEDVMRKANMFMTKPVCILDGITYMARVEYYSSMAAFEYLHDVTKMLIYSISKKDDGTVTVRFGVKYEPKLQEPNPM